MCVVFFLRQIEIVADQVYETIWNDWEVFISLEVNMSLRELKVCLLGVRFMFTFYDSMLLLWIAVLVHVYVFISLLMIDHHCVIVCYNLQ